MDKLFREQSEFIDVYLAVETQEDPFEKNVSLEYLNPLPIRALVTDLVFSQIQYKMPGIVSDKAKEITVEEKYKELILQSHKLYIDGDYYEGWRVNGKMQMRKEGDYLRIYVYVKKEEE